MKKRNLISLFAGAGGLDIGLEQAGFTTKIANELEVHACETLRWNKEMAALQGRKLEALIERSLQQRCHKNLGEEERAGLFERVRSKPRSKYLSEAEIIEGDIRGISSSTFSRALKGEELYCVAGGPPCQPFSKAGKKRSLDCAKNGDLFYEFVRIVRDLRPSWFIFENVKGLTFTKTDVLYQLCPSCGSKSIAPFKVRQQFLGQDCQSNSCEVCFSEKTKWVIESEGGGSLKIILNEFSKLGYRCKNSVLNAADFGAPQVRERLFIVGSRDGVDFNFPVGTHARVGGAEASQDDLFQVLGQSSRPWKTMVEELWPDGHPKFGKLRAGKSCLWVKNVVRPHDEPVTWSLDRPAPTVGAHQSAKLAFAPNGVPERQIFRQQWHTLGRRQGDTPPVPVKHAYLSDEELLKLQTFPSWWYLHGTRMERAFQIGNAVPPVLGSAIGQAIIKADEGRKG